MVGSGMKEETKVFKRNIDLNHVNNILLIECQCGIWNLTVGEVHCGSQSALKTFATKPHPPSPAEQTVMNFLYSYQNKDCYKNMHLT